MRMSQVDSLETYLISVAVASAQGSCAKLREKPSPLDSHENIRLQHTATILMIKYVGISTSRVTYYDLFFQKCT